jgi:ApaG protein
MKELFQHVAITPIGAHAPSGRETVNVTHEGLIVRVAVNFLPEQSRIEAGKWFWVYHIRIENESNQTVQLLTRHWRITDGRGTVNFVDDVSGCPLMTPTGSMEGHYTFRSEDGSEIKAAIPFFPLSAPATAG